MAYFFRLGSIWCVLKPNRWMLSYTYMSTLSGDISHVEIMGRHIVVLNSVKDAIEMLDKKSSKYSDRPVFHMSGNLVGFKYIMPQLRYGDRLRESRRQFHRFIGTRSMLKTYHDIQQLEVHRFLKRVYARPEQLAVHIRRSAQPRLMDLALKTELPLGQLVL